MGDFVPLRIVDQVAAGYVIEWEGYPDPGEYTTEPADVVEAADRGFSSAMAVWRRASKKTSGKKARRKSPNEMLMVNNREKRQRKSTTVTVDGQAVLKLNNYSMEDGEAGRREGACSDLEPPAKPAAKKSAYIFFCTQMRTSGKMDSEGGMAEASKVLGKMWAEVTSAQKAKFEAAAEKDRIRYDRELDEYERKMEDFKVECEQRRKDAELAEYAAVQAEDIERIAQAEARAAAKVKRAAEPRKPRANNSLEAARLRHKAAMQADAREAAVYRQAFIQQHIEVLRPFVPAKVIAKIPSSKLQPGDPQPQITTTPEWIRAEMRSYQLEGLTWLLQTYNHGISAILGDEMGLGNARSIFPSYA